MRVCDGCAYKNRRINELHKQIVALQAKIGVLTIQLARERQAPKRND